MKYIELAKKYILEVQRGVLSDTEIFAISEFCNWLEKETAEHRLHANVATVVHKEWCIGGDKGPCNCGAEQIRNAGEA